MRQLLPCQCFLLTAERKGLLVRRYLGEARLPCRHEPNCCWVVLQHTWKLEWTESAVFKILVKSFLADFDLPPLTFCRLPWGSPSLRSQAVSSNSAATREHEPARATLSSLDANIINDELAVQSLAITFVYKFERHQTLNSPQDHVCPIFVFEVFMKNGV